MLKEALVTHNYELMMLSMGEPFGIAGWQAGGSIWAPDTAIEQLRNNYLSPDSTITFVEPEPDLTALLGGIDPLAIWAPKVNTVSALYSTGWGTDGNGEAILIIAQHPDGYFYWNSVLIAPYGFSDDSATIGTPITTEE